MYHIYISKHGNEELLRRERGLLVEWCGEHEWTEIVEDVIRDGRAAERSVRGLYAGVEAGDTVVASELSRLGRSIPMLVTALEEVLGRGARIECMDGLLINDDQEGREYVSRLREFCDLEQKIRCERSKEALWETRRGGVALGRPAGSRKDPKKNVLYGKTDRLEQLLSQGMSGVDIAKELGVSRGTVYNYLNRKE